MLRRFQVTNFRCLKELEIEFEPLTVLVGPNGSGKTALLSALDPSPGVVESDFWQHRHGVLIRQWMLEGGGTRQFRAEWTESGGVHQQWSQSVPVDFQLLGLDLQALRKRNQVVRANRLAANGSNLANVFSTIPRSQQAELAAQLCSLVPLFSDVDIVPSTTAGEHELRFQDHWNKDVWYAPDEVSDGTMLLTAFLALQYQNPPTGLVAIEEPERALHPYLLEQLVDMLRRLSTGEVGRAPMQVILATHSPDLLEFVRPEEVRFLGRRADDGSVTVRSAPVADPDWPRYFSEYRQSLRQAWLSGGLGGVPGA